MNGHKDLKVFQLAYRLAMDIFHLSRNFPPEEKYSLTDQVRRSSRSVVTNIAEGYRKRQYPNAFAHKMSDSDAEGAETQVWLDFARDCGYLQEDICKKLIEDYCEVGRMLGSMIAKPERFAPRSSSTAHC
jgi:four helix bundle protein